MFFDWFSLVAWVCVCGFGGLFFLGIVGLCFGVGALGFLVCVWFVYYYGFGVWWL